MHLLSSLVKQNISDAENTLMMLYLQAFADIMMQQIDNQIFPSIIQTSWRFIPSLVPPAPNAPYALLMK